ncbi:MAG: hypothetical protein Q7T80_14745 [Methanoregula sp.]|nr:hypothetical protein [Methanoregula sp.]
MAVPGTIQPLVDKYTFHRDTYIRGQEKYNTAQLRQVEAEDGAIDTLVYELYGLTAEEIAIVEGNAK